MRDGCECARCQMERASYMKQQEPAPLHITKSQLDADRDLMRGFPAAQAAMDDQQQRAINAALIETTRNDCTEMETRCRLAIHYFKHKPIVKVFADDLRRLCDLAEKGNKA